MSSILGPFPLKQVFKSLGQNWVQKQRNSAAIKKFELIATELR